MDVASLSLKKLLHSRHLHFWFPQSFHSSPMISPESQYKGHFVDVSACVGHPLVSYSQHLKTFSIFISFSSSLSSFQCLSCSLLPTHAHSLPLKLVASIFDYYFRIYLCINTQLQSAESIYSCSYVYNFKTGQLVMEKLLVALSLKKTNSAFSVVIYCLQFFVQGWGKMRFPSYTLTHHLVMLLFKTCLGSHIFEISCVWLSCHFQETHCHSIYFGPLTFQSFCS